MPDSHKHVDMAGWIEYNRVGQRLYDRVIRVWSIFVANTNELRELVLSIESSAMKSMLVADSAGRPFDRMDDIAKEFWRTLDQRLHNMAAAVYSLVDQTRILVRHYAANDEFSDQWAERNKRIKDLPVSRLIMQLRHHLTHHDSAPLGYTERLAPAGGEHGPWDHFRIQLSAQGLISWGGWSQTDLEYLRSFEVGPALRDVTAEYAVAMQTLYDWLWKQWKVLHVPGEPPSQFVS